MQSIFRAEVMIVKRSGTSPKEIPLANMRRSGRPPASAIPRTGMPGSLQRKPAEAPAGFYPVNATASAPAVYRPNNSAAMQPKQAPVPVYRPSNGAPAVPPVCRPNAAPLLQPKENLKRSPAQVIPPGFAQQKVWPASNNRPPADNAITSAPAVYRPNRSAAMQPKQAPVPVYRPCNGAPAAPPVYRPNAAPLFQPKQNLKRSPDPVKIALPGFVQQKVWPASNSQPLAGSGVPPARSLVIQPFIGVSPTDVEPGQAPKSSEFREEQFPAIKSSLKNSGFMTALTKDKTLKSASGNFNYNYLNERLAAQQDIPTLAAEIVRVIANGSVPIQNGLLTHVQELENALSAHAHTNAGGKDIENFRALMKAGSVVPSRSKAVPNRMGQQVLTSTDSGTAAALNHLITDITQRNSDLDMRRYYIDGWYAPGRANDGFNGIRSPHQNGAGWLPQFTAANAAALETNLLARATAVGQQLQANGIAARVALGTALINAVAAANNDASSLEITIDESGNQALKRVFYEHVFWSAVPTKADRVLLAWARYATGAGAIANCPYIEFAGGGIANRFIWDYVNDTFFLSVHYNWVDGYNPFFEILGTPATI
jgi:hypothetical protein